MVMVSKKTQRLRLGLFAMTAGVIGIAGSQASAAIIETSTIKNSYSFTIGTESASSSDAGPTASFTALNTDGRGNISAGTIQLTSYLEDGNFYFLHNGVCHGGCNISITTEILFTLQNTGPDAVNLRFDSQITPGHLARNNYESGDAGGLFQFSVVQDPGASNSRTLYSARGATGGSGPGVSTSDGSVFNGLNQISNEPSYSVADWSATSLNLQLNTIAAFSTTTLRYRSTFDLLNNADCRGGLDSPICKGFQVAFGDPRNKGTVENISLFANASDQTSGLAAVGAAYDPYRFASSFVPVGSPLPDTPPVIGPIPYTTGFIPPVTDAVPEPTAWAMLVTGFGFLGGTLRSRRGRVGRQAPTG